MNPLRLLLAGLLITAGTLRADPTALAARLDESTRGLLKVAFTDLAALDAYAGAEGRTEAEVAEARAKLAAGYPPGVKVLDANDPAVEGARPGGVTFLHPSGAEARIMLRDASVSGRLASVIGMSAVTLIEASIGSPDAWPTNAWVVSNQRVVYPAGLPDLDFAFIPKDGSAPTGTFTQLKRRNQTEATYAWASLTIGAAVVERTERAVTPAPVAGAPAPVTPAPAATPPADPAPAAPAAVVKDATSIPVPPRMTPPEVASVPPAVPEPVVPAPTPEVKPAPVLPAPVLPPPVVAAVKPDPVAPAPAPAVKPEPVMPAPVLPPPVVAAVKPVTPEPVIPAPAAKPGPVVPAPAVNPPVVAAVNPVTPAPVLPAPAPSAVAPVDPASFVPAAQLQAVWSGAFMETGDTGTYKMRAEIRQKDGAVEITFFWAETSVTCSGTVKGLAAEATGPQGMRITATHIPERDALKGSVEMTPGGRVRTFYLLRLKNLP